MKFIERVERFIGLVTGPSLRNFTELFYLILSISENLPSEHKKNLVKFLSQTFFTEHKVFWPRQGDLGRAS